MSNELMTIETDYIGELNGNQQTMFCSVKDETPASRALVFNAVSNPDSKISEMINRQIMLRDVIVETVQVANPETGEVSTAPRTILIDDEGHSYQAVSAGVFNSVKRLFNLMGFPTYEEPVPITIIQTETKKGRVFSFRVDLK